MRVESVPADRGFWVGTSDKDRVYVQLTGTAESDLVEGELVSRHLDVDSLCCQQVGAFGAFDARLGGQP